MASKPKLGVFKFASCDGCQLTVLSLEDQLMQLAASLDVAYFLEASSRIESGPYDLALVEGSITTEADRERINSIRNDTRYLVTIGACATAGGIQALRNGRDKAEFLRAVYAMPEYISTLETSTAISQHVKVDFELRGCPIDKRQLLEVIRSFLAGRQPSLTENAVCLECKRRGNVCIMVASDTPCLGPVTQDGCGALCPSFDRGCYGCFGPAVQPNWESLVGHVSREEDHQAAELLGNLRSYNLGSPEFDAAGKRLYQLRDESAR